MLHRLALPLVLSVLVAAAAVPAAASATIYKGSADGWKLAVNTRGKDRASLRIPAAQQNQTYYVVLCARKPDGKGKVLIGQQPVSMPTTRVAGEVQNFSKRARSCWVFVNDDYVTKVAQIKLKRR